MLAGERFVGWEVELRVLADYVGILPGSLGGRVAREVRRVLNLVERPPLHAAAAALTNDARRIHAAHPSRE